MCGMNGKADLVVVRCLFVAYRYGCRTACMVYERTRVELPCDACRVHIFVPDHLARRQGSLAYAGVPDFVPTIVHCIRLEVCLVLFSAWPSN